MERTYKLPTEQKTVTGSSVTFNSTYPFPLDACKISFSASQSGTGDPSPTNVRPISGVSSITLGANGSATVIDLDGTRYGGVLDVLSGVLSLDHLLFTIDETINPVAVDWLATSYGVGWFYQFNWDLPIIGVTEVFDGNCDILKPVKYNDIYGHGYTGACIAITSSATIKRVYVWQNDTSLTTNTLIKEWTGNNNINITYPLATPITIQLSANELSSIIGNNTFTADTGELEIKYQDLQEKSASGAIASFNTALNMPLSKGEFAVTAYQEGSGDPSPVNNRPIHGFSEVNAVNMTGTDKAEFFRGLLRGECAYVDMSTLNWQKYAGDNTGYSFYVNVPSNASQVSSDSEIADILSNKYATTNYSTWTTWQTKDKVICQVPNAQRWIARDTDYTSVADFKSALSGKYLIYKLAIPVTPTITKSEFEMLVSAFDLIGNIYTIQFGQEVYGAEVDVVNNVAHVTHLTYIIPTANSFTSWYERQIVAVNPPNIIQTIQTVLNVYGDVLKATFSTTDDFACWHRYDYVNIIVPDNYTVADFNNNIAGTKIIYPLETPFDIQLTPTQIETLIGNNTIFADTGDVDLTFKDLDIAKRGNFREVFKIPENTKKLYGFKIDYENKTIDYLEDAVGMTPAYMDFTNNKFEYGSWENAFFMPRPCMLKRDGTVDFYLDPNNYDYRADGVTPSHVGHLGNYEASTTASKDYAVDDYIVYDSKLWQVTSAITTGDTLTEGTNISEVENAPDVEDNAMLEWGQGGQHIWYRQITNIDGTESVYISNYRVNDTFNAWSFYDAKGMLKDHFYTPIYQGSIVNNILRSISGMDYTRYCKGKTGAQEVTLAEANNVGTDKGWYTEVNCDWVLTMHLLTLMSKSLNTSAKFGNGRCGQSSSETNMLTTGSMNDKGMFWGSNTNTYGVKVFGMENQWGNQWHRMAGLLLIDNQWYYKLTRYTNDGSTATDYNSTGTGYLTQTGHTAPTANYVQEMYFTDDGAFYDKVTGSSTSASVTMYQDYFYVNASGTRYALRGGYCAYSAVVCGACFVGVSAGFGYAGWIVGASLSYR